MPSIDEPDCAKYSLEELYDVAQHIDRVRYAERYQRVLDEFEKRSGVPMPPKPLRHTPRAWLTKHLWEHGDTQRDFRAIIAWWEERRRFYNLFFFVVTGSNAVTIMVLSLIIAFRDGQLWGMIPITPGNVILSVFEFSLWLVVVIGIVFVYVNILYLFFWLIDGALSIPLRFLSWRLSVALFGIVLASTFLVLSLPAIFAFVAVLRR